MKKVVLFFVTILLFSASAFADAKPGKKARAQKPAIDTLAMLLNKMKAMEKTMATKASWAGVDEKIKEVNDELTKTNSNVTTLGNRVSTTETTSQNLLSTSEWLVERINGKDSIVTTGKKDSTGKAITEVRHIKEGLRDEVAKKAGTGVYWWFGAGLFAFCIVIYLVCRDMAKIKRDTANKLSSLTNP